MHCSFQKYTLHFKFLAGTSRGVLRHKDSFFIHVSQAYSSKVFGIGECAPLKGLSPDEGEDLQAILSECCEKLKRSGWQPESEDDIFSWVHENIDKSLPALRFGMETALLDAFHGGKRSIITNNWSAPPYQPISINGLVWMGDPQWMLEQLKDKLEAGFDCIKIKIGAIDFAEEIQLLAFIREHYTADQITIRVDANGAFNQTDVYTKLEALAKYQVHSIEQPIAAGQLTLMRKLCAHSPVDIALDEELIGVMERQDKISLLEEIQPQYIILKPTLIGGIAASREWIALAEERQIGWWITSALESNIGLNAIAQLTATYSTRLPQGLGTGQLFHNNFPSPLEIRNGQLYYNTGKTWDLNFLI